MKRIATISVLVTALAALPSGVHAQSQQDMLAVAEGAVIFSRTCARCHNARSSMERTDRAWQTIIAHMRARANLTKTQARNLVAYFQATNAPEGAAPPSGAAQGAGMQGVDIEDAGTEDAGTRSSAAYDAGVQQGAVRNANVVLPEGISYQIMAPWARRFMARITMRGALRER